MKKCVGDIIVSIDNDIRFEKKVDFLSLIDVYEGAFIYVDKIKQADEKKGGVLSNISGEENRLEGYGMFCVTKKHFMEINGFSNLLSGWGAEDALFYGRLNTDMRLANTLIHVRHQRDEEYMKTHIKK